MMIICQPKKNPFWKVTLNSNGCYLLHLIDKTPSQVILSPDKRSSFWRGIIINLVDSPSQHTNNIIREINLLEEGCIAVFLLFQLLEHLLFALLFFSLLLQPKGSRFSSHPPPVSLLVGAESGAWARGWVRIRVNNKSEKSHCVL